MFVLAVAYFCRIFFSHLAMLRGQQEKRVPGLILEVQTEALVMTARKKVLPCSGPSQSDSDQAAGCYIGGNLLEPVSVLTSC